MDDDASRDIAECSRKIREIKKLLNEVEEILDKYMAVDLDMLDRIMGLGGDENEMITALAGREA